MVGVHLTGMQLFFHLTGMPGFFFHLTGMQLFWDGSRLFIRFCPIWRSILLHLVNCLPFIGDEHSIVVIILNLDYYLQYNIR